MPCFVQTHFRCTLQWITAWVEYDSLYAAGSICAHLATVRFGAKFMNHHGVKQPKGIVWYVAIAAAGACFSSEWCAFLFVFVNVPWNTTLKRATCTIAYTPHGKRNSDRDNYFLLRLSYVAHRITTSVVLSHPFFLLPLSLFNHTSTCLPCSDSIQTLILLKLKLAFGTPKEFHCFSQKTHCQHDLTTLCHRKCKTVNLLCLFA